MFTRNDTWGWASCTGFVPGHRRDRSMRCCSPRQLVSTSSSLTESAGPRRRQGLDRDSTIQAPILMLPRGSSQTGDGSRDSGRARHPSAEDGYSGPAQWLALCGRRTPITGCQSAGRWWPVSTPSLSPQPGSVPPHADSPFPVDDLRGHRVSPALGMINALHTFLGMGPHQTQRVACRADRVPEET